MEHAGSKSDRNGSRQNRNKVARLERLHEASMYSTIHLPTLRVKNKLRTSGRSVAMARIRKQISVLVDKKIVAECEATLPRRIGSQTKSWMTGKLEWKVTNA
jgi:hypothetical protein